jgi:hypothetical protein
MQRLGLPAISLRGSRTTPQEVQNQKYQAHDKQEVDHGSAYVKCQKPKQPENNQHQYD